MPAPGQRAQQGLIGQLDLDVDVDAQTIATAVEMCAFDRLAAREIVEGFVESANPGRAFFRKGRAGAWRTDLEPTELAQIEHDHGPMMRRLGYAPALSR